jgi:endonuclease/exonuclease/phosphatase family metal-dependent hydrolase
MDKIIKVATFNIVHMADFSNMFDKVLPKGYNPPSKPNLYIDAIKKFNADIIGLNEVYNTADKETNDTHTCQTQKLANGINYPFSVYARGFTFVERNEDIGNAVVSRYPITAFKTIKVPAPKENERRPNEDRWYEDRIIIVADIDFNGEQIRFVETHFGLNFLERENMVKELVKIIDETKTPLIIAGDFNSLPDEYVLGPLYARLKSATNETGKKDVFTFSTFNPEFTLDYIFYSKHFSVVDTEIVDLKLSDHYPVTATLKLL